MNQVNAALQLRSNLAHQFLEGVSLGPNRVAHGISFLLRGIGEEPRQVFHENRADAVAAVTRNRKHGKMAHEPSDIVNENVFEAEDDRGSKNRVSQTEIGRAQSELQSRGHLVCRLLLEKKKNIIQHIAMIA